MDNQATIPEAERSHHISEMKEGEKSFISPQSLAADKDSKLWISAYTDTDKSSGYKCATLSRDKDGFSVDMSGCGQHMKSVSGAGERVIAAPDFAPIKELKGAEPSLTEEIASRILGGKPADNTLPKSLDGQAVLPTYLKNAGIFEYKPGETAYGYPFASYDKDGKVWLPESNSRLSGKPDERMCMKIEFLKNGVDLDASNCSSIKPLSMREDYDAKRVTFIAKPVRKLLGF